MSHNTSLIAALPARHHAAHPKHALRTASMRLRGTLRVALLAGLLAGLGPVAPSPAMTTQDGEPPEVLADTEPPEVIADPEPVTPTTLHVAPDGEDAGTVDGGSDAPFQTVGYALTRADGGETINVAPGTYPGYVDTLERSERVLVTAADPRNPPLLVDVEHRGGQFVEYRGVRLASVFIADDVTHRKHKSHNITIADSEITSLVPGAETCVNIRNGAHDVTITDSYIHDCRSGLRGPPTPYGRSHHIQVVGSTFQDFEVDAMQFADWDDVTIAGNVMGGALDPTGRLHNDMIQFTGRSERIVVRDNVLHDAAQLLFLQPVFGPIDDVRIENNLLFGSRAYAIQVISATNVRLINNTLWNNKRGLVLRPYPPAPLVTTDTIVANNILSGYAEFASTAAVFTGNVILGVSIGKKHLRGDFRLQPSSAHCRTGDLAWAPERDLAGIVRSAKPSIGALECAGS